MTWPLLVGAFATGLLGSGHCLGMCGSLVAALSLSGGRRIGVAFHIFYHAGRLGTYAALGWAAGWVGLASLRGSGLTGAGRILALAADLFVVAAGVATAAASGRFNVARLEISGASGALTRAVSLLRRLPPALAALPLGAALGFLPCGFLYAVLLNAGLSGNPGTGALTMVGFGIGTAPALLAFGGAARLLTAGTRSRMLRWAGVAVALMGAYNLGRHLSVPTCH